MSEKKPSSSSPLYPYGPHTMPGMWRNASTSGINEIKISIRAITGPHEKDNYMVHSILFNEERLCARPHDCGPQTVSVHTYSTGNPTEA